MRRKRMHGKKRSPFRQDPSIKDYAKYPQSEKMRVLDTDRYKYSQGTITPTPTRWEKFKQGRKKRQNRLIELFAPAIPQIQNLINVTKDPEGKIQKFLDKKVRKK